MGSAPSLGRKLWAPGLRASSFWLLLPLIYCVLRSILVALFGFREATAFRHTLGMEVTNYSDIPLLRSTLRIRHSCKYFFASVNEKQTIVIALLQFWKNGVELTLVALKRASRLAKISKKGLDGKKLSIREGETGCRISEQQQ